MGLWSRGPSATEYRNKDNEDAEDDHNVRPDGISPEQRADANEGHNYSAYNKPIEGCEASPPCPKENPLEHQDNPKTR